MESLVVGDIKGLATDNARLSLFTNEQGGIKVHPCPSNQPQHFCVAITRNAVIRTFYVSLFSNRERNLFVF
jgi:hypothetical protein